MVTHLATDYRAILPGWGEVRNDSGVWGKRLGDTPDGNPGLVRGLKHGGPVEDQGLARLHGQHRGLYFPHGGDGVQAHGGHIKPEVLIGLAHLDYRDAGPGRGAAPADGGIGAFDGLQGHHHLTPHHGALADVEPAQLPGPPAPPG